MHCHSDSQPAVPSNLKVVPVYLQPTAAGNTDQHGVNRGLRSYIGRDILFLIM